MQPKIHSLRSHFSLGLHPKNVFFLPTFGIVMSASSGSRNASLSHAQSQSTQYSPLPLGTAQFLQDDVVRLFLELHRGHTTC